MKKVLHYILGIIICVAVTDIIIGICCKYYVNHYQLPGRYEPLDRLIKKVDADILLIGNSITLNSLDPRIIEDSLSLSCYNGGIIGQGIEFSETIIDCVLQRYTPKKIILGLRPEEVGENIGEGIYDVLRPYYKLGYPSIDNHFNNVSKSEYFLLKSNLYRYNTIWVRILLYMLLDKTEYPQNGFMPKEIPHKFPQINKRLFCEQPSIDKLKCIERIVKNCKNKGVELSICFPPTLLLFPEDTIPCVRSVEAICKRYRTPCLIDYNNKNFLKRPDLFYDNVHVNYKGASLYTMHIIKDL